MFKSEHKRRRYLTNHEHFLLVFLSVESRKVVIKEGHAGFQKDLSLYGCTSSDALPLETVISLTSSSSSRNERVSALSPAMFFLCERLRKGPETGFALTWERKLCKCFLSNVS